MDTPCWVWTGRVDRYGYAVQGKRTNLHRRLYESVVGPVEHGLVLDHLCAVKRCLNPDHLQPITNAENLRRAADQRTTCRRGHDRIPENTYVGKDGSVTCEICRRESVRRWREGRK